MNNIIQNSKTIEIIEVLLKQYMNKNDKNSL